MSDNSAAETGKHCDLFRWYGQGGREKNITAMCTNYSI
jgi:hypothetical protein